MIYLLVAIAGALGALARFGIGTLIGARGFPVATLTVNIIGSFALGFVATLAVTRGAVSEPAVVAVTVGFIGAFTTFSTFSVETLTLVQSGRPAVALAYVVGSVVLGLLAALLGYAAAAVLS